MERLKMVEKAAEIAVIWSIATAGIGFIALLWNQRGVREENKIWFTGVRVAFLVAAGVAVVTAMIALIGTIL